MFCTKCGSELKPGNKFCVKCGSPVYAKDAPAAAGMPQQKVVQPQQTVTPQKNMPQQRVVQPQQEISARQSNGKKQSKKGIMAALLAAIVIAVLVIGGIIGYLMWSRDDAEYNDTEDTRVDRNADADDNDNDVKAAAEAAAETEVSATESSTDSQTAAAALAVEVDAALVMEAVEAYQAYIQNHIDIWDGDSFVFMNINADCVPELLYDSGITAGGMFLLSYYNGVVHENWLPIGGFHYLEYQNQMYLSSGRMDVYEDVMYCLRAGKLEVTKSGWYGLEDNSKLFDEDGNEIPYEYFWEEEQLTEHAYNRKIQENFDLSAEKKWIASDTLEHAFFNYTSGVPELQELTLTAGIGQTGDILPTSSSDFLTREEIQMLTDEELRLARNEIYARHGYIFKDEELQAYFMSKSWYEPTETEVTDTMLNAYEIANRDIIREVEDERK